MVQLAVSGQTGLALGTAAYSFSPTG